MFGEWRGAFEQSGLKVNLKKTKLLVTGVRGGRLRRWGGTCVVCTVEVLESTPFCASPVISGVIRDVLVWADWVRQSTSDALRVLGVVVRGVL